MFDEENIKRLKNVSEHIDNIKAIVTASTRKLKLMELDIEKDKEDPKEKLSILEKIKRCFK